MKADLLNHIWCPGCHAALTAATDTEHKGEIWQGSLVCSQCASRYPIETGMPLLYVRDRRWTSKEAEAAGWVTLHRNLGIYEPSADSVDFHIPWYPDDTWNRVARSFEIALELLQLNGAETVLDLGAGRGWAAKQFALRGCKTVAIDIVADQNVGLGRGWALMQQAGTHFERIIADGENLPFPPDQFDLVFCAAALHHASDLPLFLRQIGRTLRPGGRLCAINEPCRSILTSEKLLLQRDALPELSLGINETRPDLAEYLAAARQAGLRVIHAFAPHTRETDTATLRNYVALLGAIPPYWRQRPLRHQAIAWVKYLHNRLRLLKNGRKPSAKRRDYPDQRQYLELRALDWLEGEIILLLEKPL